MDAAPGDPGADNVGPRGVVDDFLQPIRRLVEILPEENIRARRVHVDEQRVEIEAGGEAAGRQIEDLGPAGRGKPERLAEVDARRGPSPPAGRPIRVDAALQGTRDRHRLAAGIEYRGAV